MAPSSNSGIALLDRIALAGLGLGLLLYVMPFWAEGRLRVAFVVTLVATVVHIVTSHRQSEAS